MARRNRTLKIGTRGSALALRQTEIVISLLQQANPDQQFKVVPIKTKGDRLKTTAELRTAGKGLFVKEIEQALLKRKVDLSVHSLKDMPSEQPENLVIGAVLEREEAADAYVGSGNVPIEKLPPGTVVGTSSLRRQALLRLNYPNLRVIEMKGNLDTRLAAVENKRIKMAGVVVAAAGLRRLYQGNSVEYELLPKSHFVPSPGQGTICIECRADNERVLEVIRPLDHPETVAAVTAERHLMARMEGGCQIPLGAHARLVLDGIYRLLHLTAFVGMPDGSRHVYEEATGSLEDPIGVAASLDTMLRARGATDILETLFRKARPARVVLSRNGRTGRKPKPRSRKRKAAVPRKSKKRRAARRKARRAPKKSRVARKSRGRKRARR